MSNFNNYSIEELEKVLNDITNKILFDNNIEKPQIYFAGPWFTEKGESLYKYCQVICKSIEDNHYNVYFPKEHNCPTARQTFESNVEAIKDSEIIIALIDEKDTGTAWELGLAYAMHKTIFLLVLDETSLKSKTNIMLAYNGTCVKLKDLYKILQDKTFDLDDLQYDDSWEGKE